MSSPEMITVDRASTNISDAPGPCPDITTTCRQTLQQLAAMRRAYRDMSPELSDALDNAMESLRTALTIRELEGGDYG